MRIGLSGNGLQASNDILFIIEVCHNNGNQRVLDICRPQPYIVKHFFLRAAGLLVTAKEKSTAGKRHWAHSS